MALVLVGGLFGPIAAAEESRRPAALGLADDAIDDLLAELPDIDETFGFSEGPALVPDRRGLRADSAVEAASRDLRPPSPQPAGEPAWEAVFEPIDPEVLAQLAGEGTLGSEAEAEKADAVAGSDPEAEDAEEAGRLEPEADVAEELDGLETEAGDGDRVGDDRPEGELGERSAVDVEDPAGSADVEQAMQQFATPDLELVGPDDGAALATSGPELVADHLNPDPSTSYVYRFTVCDGPTHSGTILCRGGDVRADSGWISTPSWEVPAGVLYWNQDYTWSVSVRPAHLFLGSTNNPVAGFVVRPEMPAGVTVESPGEVTAGPISVPGRTLWYSVRDVAVASLGGGLELARSYSSQNATVGSFGLGWASVLDVAVDDSDDEVVVVTATDGSQVGFAQNPDGSWAPLDLTHEYVLTRCEGCDGYVLHDGAGMRYTIDELGLLAIVDGSGNETTVVRTSTGEVTELTDAVSGRSLEFGRSGAGPLVETVTVRAGSSSRSWTFGYSGGRLAEACEPSATGCATYAYTSGATPRLREVRSAEGRTLLDVAYGADGADGAAQQATTANGTVSVSGPSGAAGLIEVSVAGGDTTGYEFVGGLLVRAETSTGAVQTWEHNHLGQVVRYVDAAGAPVLYEYDEHGFLRKRTHFRDAVRSITQRFDYYVGEPGDPLYGRLKSVSDPRFDRTCTWLWPCGPIEDPMQRYEYDGDGRLVEIVSAGTSAADVTTSSLTYTTGSEAAAGGGSVPAGLLATETDVHGVTTSYSYDANGGVAEITNASGAAIRYTRDDWGRVLSEARVESDGATVATVDFEYDAAGRPTSRVGPSSSDVVGTSAPGGGWTFRELNRAGTDFTDRFIQWHPGSPRHFGGQPYWKVSSGSGGTVRIPQ